MSCSKLTQVVQLGRPEARGLEPGPFQHLFRNPKGLPGVRRTSPCSAPRVSPVEVFVQGSRSPSASHRPSVSQAYKNCFLLIKSLGLNSELKGSGRSGVVGG